MGIIKCFYICDGKRCSEKISNWRGNCGECRHTTDKAHALTGGFTISTENGELKCPENARMFRHNDGSIYVVENEPEIADK